MEIQQMAGCPETKPNTFDLNQKICPHCNGYGSSMKDPIGIDVCTECNGSGIHLEYKGSNQ